MKYVLSLIFWIAILAFGVAVAYLAFLAHWALGMAIVAVEVMALCVLLCGICGTWRKGQGGARK